MRTDSIRFWTHWQPLVTLSFMVILIDVASPRLAWGANTSEAQPTAGWLELKYKSLKSLNVVPRPVLQALLARVGHAPFADWWLPRPTCLAWEHFKVFMILS